MEQMIHFGEEPSVMVELASIERYLLTHINKGFLKQKC
jgi:hypothetical protein